MTRPKTKRRYDYLVHINHSIFNRMPQAHTKRILRKLVRAAARQAQTGTELAHDGAPDRIAKELIP